MKNKPNGFIAFTSLLVISAAALAIATSIALIAVSNSRSSLDFKKGMESLAVAESCAEDTLLHLRDNAKYDPEGVQLTLPELSGDCTIDVAGAGMQKTIDITSTVDVPPKYINSLEVIINRLGTSVNLRSWQKVE